MISIPTRPEFWKWLMTFAYRRYSLYCEATKIPPLGVPGNRDPLAPCTGFAPRPQKLGDFGDCLTDGHYLCKQCCHRMIPIRESKDTEESEYDQF